MSSVNANFPRTAVSPTNPVPVRKPIQLLGQSLKVKKLRVVAYLANWMGGPKPEKIKNDMATGEQVAWLHEMESFDRF